MFSIKPYINRKNYQRLSITIIAVVLIMVRL